MYNSFTFKLMLTFLCTQHMALAKSNECIWRFRTQLTLGCRQTGNSITNYRWNKTAYGPIEYNDISPWGPQAQQPNSRTEMFQYFGIYKYAFPNLITNFHSHEIFIFLFLFQYKKKIQKKHGNEYRPNRTLNWVLQPGCMSPIYQILVNYSVWNEKKTKNWIWRISSPHKNELNTKLQTPS